MTSNFAALRFASRCVRSVFLAALVLASTVALAIDDEPDELNWDSLGGTRTAFAHFCDYVGKNKDFRDQLLKRTPNNSLKRSSALAKKLATVWVSPSAFADRLTDGWTLDKAAERDVVSYPGGHGGGAVRTKLPIPKSGFYRVWVEYYHDQGSVASFALRLEDPKIMELTGPMQTVVQDVFSWKFDFAEMGRRSDPLPNNADAPTGFLWESSPTVWLEKGERALTLAGMICDGPYAPRRIASVVLTEEPIAQPDALGRPNKSKPIVVRSDQPSREASKVAALWKRRPISGETNKELIALWSQWRDAFFADLADYRVEGIEGRRMASLTAFDPESNLVGTPRQIRDEKARMKEFLASFPKDVYMNKIEGEDFKVLEGWTVQDSADASDGRFLVADYMDGLCRAEYETEVPRAGEYAFWSRYLELPGYLSKFTLRIEGSDGTTQDVVFCADEEENKRSPGFRWTETRVQLPAGRVKLTVFKEYGPCATYRRYDCLIATDALDWSPEGQGEVVPTRSDKGGLVLWNGDPWRGFTRLSAPKADDVLNVDSEPTLVELPIGAEQSASLLVRNDGDAPQTVEPQIIGDASRLASWRLQAFAFSPQFGWTPYPLLERSSLTLPPGETVGIWLTFNGDVESKDETIAVKVGDREARYNVVRKGDLRDAPVPYVGGWSSPYETVSCWETFKRLGLNTLNDAIIPSEDAKKYGMKLFLKLNDTNVSPEHIAEIERSFSNYGYSCDDWAWSLMDEPGAGASDGWVELAKQMKERAPKIRLWCNPGEMAGAPPESDLKMIPYVDCYCPYADHFWQSGGGNETYQRELNGVGRKFAIRMTYTTPCFGERALGAPLDMFGPMYTSVQNKLDGWMFYALLGRYEYCNSPWDEANAYVGDQSIYLYRGASYRTISTRSAEAIRAAVDVWRAEQIKTDEEREEN